MYDENIIMTKEQREAMLERVEVLQKVKMLLLIPRLFMATTQQVACFFEVDISAIQICYQRHKKELDANGVLTYKAAEIEGAWTRCPGCRCQGKTHFLCRGGFQLRSHILQNQVLPASRDLKSCDVTTQFNRWPERCAISS